MRHQTEPEQMTRLLIVKEKAYAELDEMSRMAISVLTDEGWKFSRIGVDLRVKIWSEPMIEEVDAAHLANAKLVEHLAGAELRFVALRKEVIKGRRTPWLFAMWAIAVTGTLDAFRLDDFGRWDTLLLVGCFGMYVWNRFYRAKGAR